MGDGWVVVCLMNQIFFLSFVLLVGRRKWGEAQNELSPVGGWTGCLGCCRCRVLLAAAAASGRVGGSFGDRQARPDCKPLKTATGRGDGGLSLGAIPRVDARYLLGASSFQAQDPHHCSRPAPRTRSIGCDPSRLFLLLEVRGMWGNNESWMTPQVGRVAQREEHEQAAMNHDLGAAKTCTEGGLPALSTGSSREAIRSEGKQKFIG